MFKKFLLFLILFSLWLPLLQKFSNCFKSSQLYGAIIYHAKPVFADTSWVSANYQKNYELYINDTIGFHNTFIRLRNQLDYSLFNKCHSFDTEIGTDGFLVPTNQLAVHVGKAKNSVTKFDYLINQLIALKDTLKHHNKNLIVMFAPSKGAVSLKNAPDWYDTTKVGESDYEYMLRKVKAANIANLDFNGWFMKANDTTKNHDLFPRQAAHWSTHAAAVAGDSMVRFFEKFHNYDLPDLQFAKIEVTDTARFQDDDLFRTLNLFTKCPKDRYLYPTIQYNKTNKAKTKVLFISDSFFFVFHYLPSEVFDEYSFWFYNSSIYSDGINNWKKVKDIDLKQELEKYDDIVLMSTEWSLCDLGWGFIENVLKLYGTETKKTVEYYREFIKNDKNWYQQIIEKAKQNHLTIDEQLTADANYMLSMEKK